jgi:hypothetical protein
MRTLRALALGVMAAVCGVPASAQSKLAVVSAPKNEVFPDSLVRISLSPVPAGPLPDSCDLFHGPAPAGNRLEGHGTRLIAKRSASKDSSALLFDFKPMDNDAGASGPQLSLGFHYMVASCRDGKILSPEFPVWVAARQAASILTPKAQETSSSPDISWTPVPGVPAYHLLLSDQALDIDTEKGTVSGASIIWQVITTKTGIAYGTPDPSGTFSKMPAPPLSPNVPYNLVILNNYDGRSSLSTSTKAQGLRLFTIQSSGSALKPPANVAPAQNAGLAVPRDSAIQFKWRKASAMSGAGAANTYQLFIYSLEAQDGLDVLIPIWHTEVTDTFAVLDAKRTLLTKRYIWKVFATAASGASVVGDTTSFLYRNDVQTLSLTVEGAGANGDTLPLGDVRIAVTPLDASGDPLPLFTNSAGGAEKVLAVGNYSLSFSKDGYLSQTRTTSLGALAPVNLSQVLQEASCRITGRAVDKAGAGLVNVEVTSAGGGRTVKAVTDAQGFFLLGVAPGTQTVSFSKPDYQARPDTTFVLASGKSADLGSLTLAKATGSLTGKVSNESGQPLAGCRIAVKTLGGASERTLLTDDKGAFSAYFAPGTYTVIASRTGFSSAQKTVQLSDAANLAFTLSSGASLIKGRISILTWPTGAASQTSPLPGAALELTDKATGKAQKAESDLRGEYSFSADTGSYMLKAAYPGRTAPDSVAVRIASARSTVNRDMSLKGFASVLGTIRISPDTVADPAAVTVGLLSASTSALVVSATPQRAPEPGAAGAMGYALQGVPDGSYRLVCGLPGYGLDAEPSITIANSVWKTGEDLMLKKAVKSITFALKADGASTAGRIRLITPQASEFPAGDKLEQAPAGTYILNASPDSLSLIPLSRFSFRLPASGTADTTVNLDFPFAHQSGPLSFRNGEIQLKLDARAPIDSAWIVYGYGNPVDTFAVPSSQLSGAAGTRTLRFKPGAQGGRLTYYFILRSGPLTYSNEEPARRFRAEVEASKELAFLKLTAGDTLRLPARYAGELQLHAYDAAGRRLDSAVDARGTFSWRADAGLPLKLAKGSKRTLSYQTSGPSANLGKKGAQAAAGWGALSVTVKLDDVEQTLSLPAKVVTAVVNKLVLSSTLGEVTEIPDPAPFGLFASGFDTTTTPPAPVTPNPVLSILPAGAGSIREMQVELDPAFIGPVRILARHVNADGSEASTELGAYRDSLSRGLNVGQTLSQGDSVNRFFHDDAVRLAIPDSAFSGPQTLLRLYKRRVAKTFSSGVTYAVSGDLYEISNPGGASFAKPPRLTLGLPSGSANRKFDLKRFDAAKLDWLALADSAASDTAANGVPALSAEIRDMDGSYYGLLSASRGLTAGEVRIVPNPFSPLVMATRDGNTRYGTRIHLEPESDRSAEVTVSVKIYNMDGELVRVLVDHKTVPKAPVDFYWDGKADGGRWARNGRYTVKISVGATGTSSKKETIKPVVVFQ